MATVNYQVLKNRLIETGWSLRLLKDFLGIRGEINEYLSGEKLGLLCYLLNCDTQYISGNTEKVDMDNIPDMHAYRFGAFKLDGSHFKNMDIGTIDCICTDLGIGHVIINDAEKYDYMMVPSFVIYTLSRSAKFYGLTGFDQAYGYAPSATYSNNEKMRRIVALIDELNSTMDTQRIATYAKHATKCKMLKSQLIL
jgi:hypothetical protein